MIATGEIQGLCEFCLYLDAQSQFNNKLIASICFTIAQEGGDGGGGGGGGGGRNYTTNTPNH